ncbi:protein OXIDATIVE STRESS 3 LIKE 1-like [Vicia villosa]|uniref:protein OXIDATIVE STRESS 3 LIKE 1-like n=1 Tax=Vicia villosa TaxID=3911 RepID=UPI00273CCE8C|nr:protein OXIDATIVE STRESS 3 LIKE 1-like [Vicia villosa]
MVVPFSLLDKMITEEEKAWMLVEGEDEDEQCSSSTTSSIGKDSDESKCGDIDDENEVQNAYKYDEPFNMMESLQDLLPIRKGISKYYDGKSKSFMSLANAVSSSSVKDIAKPENAYTRRRRNLMAFNLVWEKNRNFLLKSNNGAISKRTISLDRSTVALAFAMNCDSSSSCSSEESTSSSNPRSPPPLQRSQVSSASSIPSSYIQQNFSDWQSFSLADLQQCDIIEMNSSLRNEAEHLSR